MKKRLIFWGMLLILTAYFAGAAAAGDGETGTITINFDPPQATWHPEGNDDTVFGSGDIYTYEFLPGETEKEINIIFDSVEGGYETPAPIPTVLTPGDTLNFDIIYQPIAVPKGTLTISISPADAGGKWIIDGTEYDSGQIYVHSFEKIDDNVELEVTFSPVSGYDTPESQTFILSPGMMLDECVEYAKQINADRMPVKPIITESLPSGVTAQSTPKTLTVSEAAGHTGFSSGSLTAGTGGAAMLTNEAVSKTLTSILEAGQKFEVDPISFPIFEAKITKGDHTSAVSYIVSGADLYKFGAEAPKIKLYKLKPDKPLAYTYTSTLSSLTDGHFTILDISGGVAAEIKADEAQYQVVVAVKDNGDYDLNNQDGVVTDPAALVKITAGGGGGGGGESGVDDGGCNAVSIPALLGLAFIAAPAVYRRKR